MMNGYNPWQNYPPPFFMMPNQTAPRPKPGKREFKDFLRNWEMWEEWQKKHKKEEKKEEHKHNRMGVADWFCILILITPMVQLGYIFFAVQMLKGLR